MPQKNPDTPPGTEPRALAGSSARKSTQRPTPTPTGDQRRKNRAVAEERGLYCTVYLTAAIKHCH